MKQAKQTLFKAQKMADTLLCVRTKSLPLHRKLPTMAAQTLCVVMRDMSDSQLSLRAMSLVYTTLITLVPLLALSFSVLKGFGVHNQIEPTLMNLLSALGPAQSAEVTERILSFVDNMRVGILGAAGLGLLIYMVVSLMQKIESALNYIWRVGRGRGFAARLADYLTALLVGPLLIFMSTGITAALRHADIVAFMALSPFLAFFYEIVGLLIPWVLLGVGFSAIYIFMPNIKVHFIPAFVGGLCAAAMWKLMGFLFALFIANSSSYVAVYAAFATLIVFMIWIYLGWFVILIGANIAFYIQNPRYLRINRNNFALSPRLLMTLGVTATAFIGRAHYKSERGWTLEGMSNQLNVPLPALHMVADALEQGKIIRRDASEPPHYFPAVPFEKTKMDKVFQALESAGEKGALSLTKISAPKYVSSVIDNMTAARFNAEGDKTIYDTLVKESASKAKK